MKIPKILQSLTSTDAGIGSVEADDALGLDNARRQRRQRFRLAAAAAATFAALAAAVATTEDKRPRANVPNETASTDLTLAPERIERRNYVLQLEGAIRETNDQLKVLSGRLDEQEKQLRTLRDEAARRAEGPQNPLLEADIESAPTQGLSSANDGKAFNVIMNALNHAGRFGYTITAHLYKFEDYGLPQARHRYILIGIRGDLGKTFQVPAPSGLMRTCEEALRDIPPTAANQETTRQTSQVVERLSLIPEGWNVWQAEEAGLLPNHLKLNVKGARLSQIYRRLDSKKPSYTITGSGGGGTHVYHWSEPRALTNRERARLQTFPDDFVFYGSKESVRKQIGMAVPCDGAQLILEALLKTFEGVQYKSVSPSVGIFLANTFNTEHA